MQQFSDNLKFLIYAILIYLNINAELMQVLFWAMLADTVLGTLAAMTKKNGQVRFSMNEFSMNRLIAGLFSKFALLLIPAVTSLFLKAIGYDEAVMITAYAIKIIVASEVISSLTNVQAIRTGEKIDNKDYITLLIDKVKKFIQKYINKILK